MEVLKKVSDCAKQAAYNIAYNLNPINYVKEYHEGEREGLGVTTTGVPPSADQSESSSSKARTEPTGCKTESQTVQDEIGGLKDRIVVLERERSVLMGECSRLQSGLRERSRLEVAFPKLVKRLHRLCDMPEIQDILAENGLTLDSDFANFTDGFMRVKNEGATKATLARPALVHGDDLVEPGIVFVPLGEPGAEPPKSEDN